MDVPDPIDWPLVVALADAWELTPVIGSKFRTHFPTQIPDHEMHLIHRREIESRAFSVVLAVEQAAVISALEAAGIEAMALKGPVLSVLAYDDESIRPSSDIDVLVRPSDLRAARDILAIHGFAPLYPHGAEHELARRGHALELAKGKIKVELHPELLSRHLALKIDSEVNLWSASRLVQCGGRAIRTLGPEHTMLFHCAHATKHQWSRVKWILDVAQLWDRLSDDSRGRLLSGAESSHASRVLGLGLGLAATSFGLTISTGGLSKLKGAPNLQAKTLSRLGVTGEQFRSAPPDNFNDVEVETILFWLQARERLRDRLATILRIAFKPTGVGSQSRYSALTRPVRLMSQVSRHLFQRVEKSA